MTSSGTCQECGTELPSGSPGGFCPKCMLGLALSTAETDEASGVPASSRADDVQKLNSSNQSNPPNSKTDPIETLNDQITGYRLLEEIGHGGCGVVFMAEQEKPVHRRVALKVIKIGMDTRQVVARFEAERQVLAKMDHPNIAKVLDAGATSSGRPYFAMELVGGLKITDFCDQNAFTADERLRLFVQVCRAIQHAHQKGIIHRDIKPSNVLVAQHDGVAVPKVIDFGIAKATQGKLTDQTLFTAFEQFIGTPVYMSPEQAQLGGLDVDTRSDIYSLGVLLYELLTGKPPFELQPSNVGGLDAIRRTVIEKEPVRPSTRLSAMREAQLANVARARGIDAPRLVKMLRGDLDWIVMRCLEKDRRRRYETANGLAMDVQRYLDHEPVLARPPSALYRIQKFVIRNKLATLSAAAIATTLVLGIIVSTWQAVKATHAERAAQTARKLATDELRKSYLAEARALRISQEAGASFDSLAAIGKAALIRPSLELRNEAIASLVQADIRLVNSKPLTGRAVNGAADLGSPRYAVCDDIGRVIIKRVSDDNEVASLPTTNSAAVGVWAFSPNGELVGVYYADHRMRVWDWEKSRLVLDLPSLVTAEFSADSSHLAIYSSGTITLYEMPKDNNTPAREQKRLQIEEAPWALDFDPKGKLLAAASGTQTNLVILDLNSGKPVRNLPHSLGIYGFAWSPDAKHLVTAGFDGFLHIWDARNGKELKRLLSNQCVNVAFNPQGTMLVSAGWDGRTRLWDFPNCRQLVTIYKSGVIIGFSPDGRTLVESHWDGRGLDYFEIAYAAGLNTVYDHEAGAGPPSGTASFSRDGKLLAFQTADGVELWDVAANGKIRELGDDETALVGFDAEDRHVILADSKGLLLWPIGSSGHSALTLVESQASSTVAGPLTRVPQTTLGATGGLSMDGEHCFLIGSNRCQIFNTRTFARPVTTGMQLGMRFVAANLDCSLVASGAWLSSGVMVWDGHTGELVKSFLTENTTAVQFSPDGRYLVTATADRYVFWNVGSWSQAFTIPQAQNNDFVPMMAFSRNGRIFAGTHSRKIVRLHDAQTGKVLADLEPPDPRIVTALAFNEDGSRLAVCEGYLGTRIWDLQTIRSNLAPMGLDWEISSRPSIHAAR